MNTTLADTLVNNWQQRFPLCSEPFAELARQVRSNTAQVLSEFKQMRQSGSLSRIGGVWGAGAGGSALLCAFKVPVQRLDEIADLVSRPSGRQP